METTNKTSENLRLLKLDNNTTRERQIIVINAILDILANLVLISDIQGDMIKKLQEILHEPIITADEIEQAPKKRGRPKKLPDLQDDLEGRN